VSAGVEEAKTERLSSGEWQETHRESVFRESKEERPVSVH
jgi:hypothetical protein